jgi:hypothetical protein
MNIEQLKTSIPFLAQAGLVPNIIGKHGIGKSSVVAQYAKENGYSFHPFFLSQMNDVGDLLGLPEFDRDKSGKAIATSFVHPAKLPRNKKSILFFDELNRASKDLLQAIFQLALEGTVHDYTLPADSIIIMAMNPATDDYSVLDFADKAFADRFVHINLDPTHEEFHRYMSSRYTNSAVSSFLQQQTKLLEETDLQAVTLDFVKPSRRSWDRLQKLENTGMPENLFREAGMGIVGAAAMIAYSSWKETQVKIVDGKEVLDNYKKVQDRYLGYFKNVTTGEALENPRTDIVTTVCSSFVEELTNRLKEASANKKEISKKEAKNALAFLLDSPIENAYAALLNLKSVAEFTMDNSLKAEIHESKELIAKIREARVAKTKYKAEKGESLTDDEKALINA